MRIKCMAFMLLQQNKNKKEEGKCYSKELWSKLYIIQFI